MTDNAGKKTLWPDIKEIHDVIADSLINGLTYSNVRDAATQVQKLYAAALSPRDGKDTLPPDWKQDQAETSRLPRKVTP